MKIYKKQNKLARGSGHFFFGDWNEVPIGISYAVITKNNITLQEKDPLHYHKKGCEFYLVIDGKGILEVEKKEVILDKDKLLMVEPGEKHYLKRIEKLPFILLVINSIKDKNDKVVVK